MFRASLCPSLGDVEILFITNKSPFVASIWSHLYLLIKDARSFEHKVSNVGPRTAHTSYGLVGREQRGSDAGKDERFRTLSKRLDRLWGAHSFLFIVYRFIFPQI